MFSILNLQIIRTLIALTSGIFAVAFVMLMTGMITIQEIAVILKLSPEATAALTQVYLRFHGFTNNLINIFFELIKNMIDWTGASVDTNKINDALHPGGYQPQPTPTPIVPMEPLEPTMPNNPSESGGSN
jgi:hypothetical protein